MPKPLHPSLRALAARAGSCGIFLDFDGSLAPIVAEPADARAVPGVSATLERLARRFAVVAIVSGRSAADLARRVRAPGVRLVGLHGMEEHTGAEVLVRPEAAAAASAVARAAGALDEALRGVRGAMIERKGLALAVHFRRAEDPAGAERLAAPVVRSIAAAEGLVIVPGRLILEVRPAGGGDKGDAVRRIAAAVGITSALAVGDDVGDLPMLRAAGELSGSVRVAVVSAESPPELASAADIALGSPQETAEMLAALAKASTEAGPPAREER